MQFSFLGRDHRCAWVRQQVLMKNPSLEIRYIIWRNSLFLAFHSGSPFALWCLFYFPKVSFKSSCLGFPWWLSGKESPCQCRRHRFNPWSKKISHATEQLSLVNHNYWACAPESGSHNYRVCVSRNPWFTREATAIRSLPNATTE